MSGGAEPVTVPVTVPNANNATTLSQPATAPVEPVTAAPVPVTAEPVPVTASKPDQPVTATDDQCLKHASILSTFPSSCINPNAVPQLRKLVEAAIYQPVAAAGGELVSNALELTGNAALVEAALATALTPEQAAMLKTMSDDPKVAVIFY